MYHVTNNIYEWTIEGSSSLEGSEKFLTFIYMSFLKPRPTETTKCTRNLSFSHIYISLNWLYILKYIYINNIHNMYTIYIFINI